VLEHPVLCDGIGGRTGARKGSGEGSRGARELKVASGEELDDTDRADPGVGGTPMGGVRWTSHGVATEGRVE
jgi:hypothetical protein